MHYNEDIMLAIFCLELSMVWNTNILCYQILYSRFLVFIYGNTCGVYVSKIKLTNRKNKCSQYSWIFLRTLGVY
jgi:hypothetical protein